MNHPLARMIGNPEPLRVSTVKLVVDWVTNPNNTDYNKIFFENFFPSLERKVLVADHIIIDPRWGIYRLVCR